MKVLHITNAYPTTNNPDYGVFIKDQIEKVNTRGIESDLLFINAREKGILEYLIALKKIRNVYKHYDIIHCFHGLTLIDTFFATAKKPILVSFLNNTKYESLTNNRIAKSLFIIIYNRIISSKRVFTIFKDKIPEKRKNDWQSFYLPNGVDLTAFYPIDKQESCRFLNLDETKSYILFVASKNKMRVQKRYDIFRATMDILKSQYPSYNFEELVLSNVPREQCKYYFNAASLHLLTSNFEGSPNSVKEAMSCNIPVVSTDVGNVKLMIKGADNCFISDQNPNSISEFIIKSLKSPKCNLREVLISNGLSCEDKTSELIAIYTKIINGKGVIST